MAGDPRKTSIWANADVYVNFSASPTFPTDTTTALDAEWNLVGLLDGEAGFTEAREEETSEHYAWGGILHKRTRSQHKRTIAFTALEDNDTVFRLVNPGSERTIDAETGLITETVKVPTTESFAVLFETTVDGRTRRRWAQVAEVQEVGEIKDAETEPTVYEITTVIFPESDGTLLHTIADDPTASAA